VLHKKHAAVIADFSQAIDFTMVSNLSILIAQRPDSNRLANTKLCKEATSNRGRCESERELPPTGAVGWVEPNGRANARPMAKPINRAIWLMGIASPNPSYASYAITNLPLAAQGSVGHIGWIAETWPSG
jgi:hypothetical protein